MKVWKETEFSTFFYYDDGDGRIIGVVHKLGTQSVIYLAKVLVALNGEQVLGQYVDSDFARKAVERYWLIEEKTLIE